MQLIPRTEMKDLALLLLLYVYIAILWSTYIQGYNNSW